MESSERSARDAAPAGAERADRAVYIISVAAELSGVHPQTLRIYERKGLLSPARTAGNTRRYSERDIERLREIQRLTHEEGVNLAGARRIMELEEELDRLRSQMQRMRREVTRLRRDPAAVSSSGGALVPLREIRRLMESLPWT
jgi:MerR family transcriptional regulator/heat shock protein HspR